MTSPEKTEAGERERDVRPSGESGPRPASAREPQLVRYTGRSMWPTMQAGDLLVVESPLTAPLGRATASSSGTPRPAP